ncbi:flavodoxin [bacterium]|nr:flavodoxin [bacterium]
MQKYLVTYASKAGSTAEVAEAIGAQLRTRNIAADVRPIEDVSDLGGYDRVIVGSAIRMGCWLPQAVDFVKRHAVELTEKQSAIFTVHMLNADDSEESRQQRVVYVEDVHTHFTPQQEAFFTGKMDLKRLNFVDRFIAKMVKAKDADQRDWNAIRGWAQKL